MFAWLSLLRFVSFAIAFDDVLKLFWFLQNFQIVLHLQFITVDDSIFLVVGLCLLCRSADFVCDAGI